MFSLTIVLLILKPFHNSAILISNATSTINTNNSSLNLNEYINLPRQDEETEYEHPSEEEEGRKLVLPEVRQTDILTTGAALIAKIADIGMKIHAGNGSLVVKELLEIIFGKEPPPVTTCDYYYIDRAKLAETFLRSSQSPKGGYLVFNPESNTYKKVMYNPLLDRLLPPAPRDVVFYENPYPGSDVLSSEEPKARCKTEAKADSPVMAKLMDMFMEAPFIPESVKTAYKTAKKIGNYKYGKEVLKLIGRGIQVLANMGNKNSTREIIRAIDYSLSTLRIIAKNKSPEKDTLTKALDDFTAKEKRLNSKKVHVIYDPFVTVNGTGIPLFGPRIE